MLEGGTPVSTANKRLSPQEYLALERQAETRSEYFGGEMFAMSGASYEHNLIKDNLAREAGNQLKAGPCRVVTSDMRVKINATGLYTYPDIVIVCSEPEFEDGYFDTLLNPLVVVEILSDSTEKYDRGAKFRHYQKIPSLREYVLVSQDQPLIERYACQPDGSWNLVTFDDRYGTFKFATIAAQIPMIEIYTGVRPSKMTGTDSGPA
jgi:Uma2 family endonuclease